jgi:competence ComEA-like helix-hairpin-helix protein
MKTDEIIEHDGAEQSGIQFFAFVIAVFVAVIFSCCFAGWLKSEQPPRLTAQAAAGAVELESRINPNIASAASLARLPQIGSSRAEAIIEYRESISRGDSSRAAFRCCDDLQQVKGIGLKTVKNLCKWLKFE